MRTRKYCFNGSVSIKDRSPQETMRYFLAVVLRAPEIQVDIFILYFAKDRRRFNNNNDNIILFAQRFRWSSIIIYYCCFRVWYYYYCARFSRPSGLTIYIFQNVLTFIQSNIRIIIVSDDCEAKEGTPCQNGACLDSLCHCNDGYGGCSCQVPGNY